MSACAKCGLNFGIWSIRLDLDLCYYAICLDCEGEYGDPVDPKDYPDLDFEGIAKMALESLMAKQGEVG